MSKLDDRKLERRVADWWKRLSWAEALAVLEWGKLGNFNDEADSRFDALNAHYRKTITGYYTMYVLPKAYKGE